MYIYIHLYIYISICSYAPKTQVFTLHVLCMSRKFFTNSTASPKKLVQAHWPRNFTHFPWGWTIEDGTLGRCRSTRNPLVYQWEGGVDSSMKKKGWFWRAMFFVWKWELVGVVVGCCFEKHKCEKGMDGSWWHHLHVSCVLDYLSNSRFCLLPLLHETNIWLCWWRWIHAV